MLVFCGGGNRCMHCDVRRSILCGSLVGLARLRDRLGMARELLLLLGSHWVRRRIVLWRICRVISLGGERLHGPFACSMYAVGPNQAQAGPNKKLGGLKKCPKHLLNDGDSRRC